MRQDIVLCIAKPQFSPKQCRRSWFRPLPIALQDMAHSINCDTMRGKFQHDSTFCQAVSSLRKEDAHPGRQPGGGARSCGGR